MNNYSIDFYNKIADRKQLSEVFLGAQNILWRYSVVNYMADCTEGLDLSLFDRAICGILDLDGAVTMSRLGEILGLNVESDPANGKYADNAELTLLSDAVDSLITFNMVEQDPMTGNIRLSELGKEYYHEGRKFKTTSNREFSVYYDLTSGNNAQAKTAFEFLNGENTPGRIHPEYYDEARLKSFIHEQLPDIYDTEKGNSFTNLAVMDNREIVSNVLFGILYNVQLRQFRFVGFLESKDGIKENDFFTVAANNNESVQKEIIDAFIMRQQNASGNASDVQEEFEQLASEAQGLYDFNKYSGEDPEPIAEEFQKQRPLVEQECFWNNLQDCIGTTCSKVFFNFDNLTLPMLAKLNMLSKERPELYMYILYRRTTEQFADHFGNVFFYQAGGSASSVFCCTDEGSYEFVDFILPDYPGKSIPMVHHNEEANVNLGNLERNFAQIFVPKLYQQTMDYLDIPFEGAKRDVTNIPVCDDSLMAFKEYVNEDLLQALAEKKMRVFNAVKKMYEEKLLKKLEEVIEGAKVDEIKKLDAIQIWRDKVSEILGQADASYINLNETAAAFRKQLSEREQFIRDELMAKTYIIDTNVFLDDPDILARVGGRDRVVLSAAVVSELDQAKAKYKGTLSENAKTALRNCNFMLKNHKKRYKAEKGDLKILPEEFRHRDSDNMILAVAVAHRNDNPCLITSDNGLQIKAATCDIPVLSLRDFIRVVDEKDAKARAKAEAAGAKEDTK